MEEIGLQFNVSQEKLLDAVRRYVSQGGMRLIEECPLREGMSLLRTRGALKAPTTSSPAIDTSLRRAWRAAHLADLFESYFDYFFRIQRRRAVVVGPTVGRWTAILYDEPAIDCNMLRALAAPLNCRAVGYCFIEDEEYSYVEMAGDRVVELFSSFLTDGGGQSFWSARNSERPLEGSWIAQGFLKQRYQFIHGFYDLPFVRGKKAEFCCYRYGALPDRYDPKDNYPLSDFRYFYFHCAPPGRTEPTTDPARGFAP